MRPVGQQLKWSHTVLENLQESKFLPGRSIYILALLQYDVDFESLKRLKDVFMEKKNH